MRERPAKAAGAGAREPSQTRKRPTLVERDALLAAGEAVIVEQGFVRATVEGIAERAKLSTDTFYAHFQGKGALLRALNDQFVERMLYVTDESTRPGIWRGAPARDVVEVAVRSVLDTVIEHAGLVRAFLAQGATDPALALGLRRVGAHLSERLLTVLGECSGVPVRPKRAISFSLLLSVALAHHYVLVGDDWSGIRFSKEELAEETARAISAYLGLEPTIVGRVPAPDSTPAVSATPTTQVKAVRSRTRQS
jgi:AcrR family transcriptional regulator